MEKAGDMLLVQETQAAVAPPKKKKRRHELDLMRGLALLVMVIGHNVRVGEAGDSFFQLFLLSIGELFSSLFMLISGVNVIGVYKKAAVIPGFQATRFYVKSSVFLFIMGITYNMIVGTMVNVDIIQSMALGTLAVYLLLYAKTPNWLVGLITFAFFFVGVLAYGNALILNPEVNSHFLFNYLIHNGSITPESMKGLIPGRYLFVLFGPIPWIGYFTYGLFIDRLRGWKRYVMAALMLAMAVAAVYLPYNAGHSRSIIGFKTNLRYTFQTLGLFGLWYYLMPLAYAGKNRIGRFIEGWGVQSLIILMFHWFYIAVFSFLVLPVATLVDAHAYRWTRAMLVFVCVLFTVGPIAKIQDKWIKIPKFEKRAKILMAVGVVVFIWGKMKMVSAKPLIGATLVFIGSYAAAWSFTFLYPYLRQKWQRECMPK